MTRGQHCQAILDQVVLDQAILAHAIWDQAMLDQAILAWRLATQVNPAPSEHETAGSLIADALPHSQLRVSRAFNREPVLSKSEPLSMIFQQKIKSIIRKLFQIMFQNHRATRAKP